MLSLPPLRLGERIVCLPLSPLGSIDLANLWLNAGAGERPSGWETLLVQEPALALWAALVGPPHPSPAVSRAATAVPASLKPDCGTLELASLAVVCEARLLPAYQGFRPRSATPSESATHRDGFDAAAWSDGLWAIRAARRGLRADVAGLTGEVWTAEWLGDAAEWTERAQCVAVEGDLNVDSPSDFQYSNIIEAMSGRLESLAALRRKRRLGALPELTAEIKSALLARWSTAGPAVDLVALAQRLGDAAEQAVRFRQELAQQKLVALRDLAYGASHEINNPLANIATRAQGLMRDERDPERRRGLAVIASQAMRAHTMITDMMLFAKPPALRPALVALEELPTCILAELGTRAADQQTVLAISSPTSPALSDSASPVAMADREQLLVALRALVENSLEALGQGGRVEIGPLPPTAATCGFQVIDNGPGIPIEARSRLFDPYYSGREAGRGLGLGLCKAWRIVTDHGGRLSFDEQFAPGARFVLELPRHQDSSVRRVLHGELQAEPAGS